jgi:hypothetical protein
MGLALLLELTDNVMALNIFGMFGPNLQITQFDLTYLEMNSTPS